MSALLAALLALFLGAPPKARFEFSTFGSDRAMQRAERIVEARADSVIELPIGTAIARFQVVETLLPLREETPSGSLVVLANRGQFRGGGSYLLFLSSYRRGSRYVALARIAEGDRDYAAKKRVLRQFVKVDRIADARERSAAILDLLISNCADRNAFVRWNALSELKAYVALLPDEPGAKDRARLVGIHGAEPAGTYKTALAELLRTLGVELERTDRG